MRKKTLIIRPLLPALLLASILAGPVQGAEKFTLVPEGDVATAPIGSKSYLEVGASAVRIPLEGPGRITGYARAALAADAPATPGALHLSGVPELPAGLDFSFKPSSKSTFKDGRAGVPSGGRKIDLQVPAGRHVLELTSDEPGGRPMLLILYYEGPAQPLPEKKVAKAKPKKKKKPAIDWRRNVSIDFIYNDNILSNSPDDLVIFEQGLRPEKFVNDSSDDLVVAPAFNIEARMNPIPLGQTRLKFAHKSWIYTNNDLKSNYDFHFYLRQYFGKSTSLEFYFHFAPEQYIRQLSDRSPLDDRDTPLQYPEFRFQRNVWNTTWRHKLSSSLSIKLLYEENYRYYNEPFVENDIDAWEVRGNLAWKMNKALTWNFDYSFEDAQARGLDMVGETIETSDNSDPSYERDLYRIGLDIRSKKLRPLLDRIGMSFLFMDYYYTTEKSLVEAPFNAGRRDKVFKGTVEVRRRLAKPLWMKMAVRRTERTAESPWEGDLTTDKDFVQWLYWISFAYSF